MVKNIDIDTIYDVSKKVKKELEVYGYRITKNGNLEDIGYNELFGEFTVFINKNISDIKYYSNDLIVHEFINKTNYLKQRVRFLRALIAKFASDYDIEFIRRLTNYILKDYTINIDSFIDYVLNAKVLKTCLLSTYKQYKFIANINIFHADFSYYQTFNCSLDLSDLQVAVFDTQKNEIVDIFQPSNINVFFNDIVILSDIELKTLNIDISKLPINTIECEF